MSEQAIISEEEYAAWKLRRVVVGKTPIVHKCGHAGEVDVYSEDYFYENRVANVMGKECRQCRWEKHGKIIAQRTAEKQENRKRDEERKARAKKRKEGWDAYRKFWKEFDGKPIDAVPLEFEMIVSRRANLAWQAALTAGGKTVSLVVEKETELVKIGKLANRLAYLWYLKDQEDRVRVSDVK